MASSIQSASDNVGGLTDKPSTGDSDIDSDEASFAFGNLAEDIEKFKTNPKPILDALDRWVCSPAEHRARWFEILGELWELNPPKTPKKMASLALRAMFKAHYSHVPILDIRGFLFYYHLPGYPELLEFSVSSSSSMICEPEF